MSLLVLANIHICVKIEGYQSFIIISFGLYFKLHINFIHSIQWKGRIPEVIFIEGIRPQPDVINGEQRQHRELRALPFATSVWVHWHPTVLCLETLSEKSWKSNNLQMWLQRQHFLLSYFQILSGFEPETSRMVVRYSTIWAIGARGNCYCHCNCKFPAKNWNLVLATY